MLRRLFAEVCLGRVPRSAVLFGSWRIGLAVSLALLAVLAGTRLWLPGPAHGAPPPGASCADAGQSFEQASTGRTEYAFDSPGHVVEAEGVAWLGIQGEALELLGSETGCWRGGLVDGPYDDGSVYECNRVHCPGGVCPSPCLAYHSTACVAPESAGGQVLEDLECAHYGDGVSRELESGDVVVRRMHLRELNDDAIEDDYGLSNTRVFDTLIDGAHLAFGDRQRSSQDNDATGTEWEVRRSLVRVRPNANPYKQRPGHGGIWKGDHDPSHQHRYRLTDNVFVAEGLRQGGHLFPVVGYVDECAGNVLLWAGPISGEGGWLEAIGDQDDFADGLTDAERLPALEAAFPGCFRVVLKPETQPEAEFLETPLAELDGKSWSQLVAEWKAAPTTTTTSTTTTTTTAEPTTTSSSTAAPTTTSTTTAPPTTTPSSTTTTTTAEPTTTSSSTAAPTTTTTSTTTAPPTTTPSSTTTTTTAQPTTSSSSTAAPTTTTTTAPPTTTTTSSTTTTTTAEPTTTSSSTAAPTTTTTTTTTAAPTTTTTAAQATTTTTVPATPPSVVILSPASGSVFSETAEIPFSATANDPETGDVSATLVWTSQRDGVIGSGPSFSLSGLSRGRHDVTATATDPAGNAGSAAISLQIRR